jgi:beta-phosphoglucomutase
LAEAAIFDWDGTLADTRQVIVASFQKALRSVNIKTSAEFIERRIGTGAAQTFQEILQKSGKPSNDALIKSLLEKKIQAEIDLSGDVKLFDGAEELLQSLQGKVKVALASMNNRAVIDPILTTMNLHRFFNVVLTVEEVKKFKPDPEIFLKAAAKLGISPEKCVVLEDSIFGVQAAKNSGMSCVAVLTGVYTRSELEKAKPELIVDSLKQKDRILTLILQQNRVS